MLLFLARLKKPKRARSHRNTGSSQQFQHGVSSGCFGVKGNVGLLGVEIGFGPRTERIEPSADVHLSVGFTAEVPRAGCDRRL